MSAALSCRHSVLLQTARKKKGNANPQNRSESKADGAVIPGLSMFSQFRAWSIPVKERHKC